MEVFTIYALVLTSYFPQRLYDSTAYKLLILHTYRQLSGRDVARGRDKARGLVEH